MMLKFVTKTSGYAGNREIGLEFLGILIIIAALYFVAELIVETFWPEEEE